MIIYRVRFVIISSTFPSHVVKCVYFIKFISENRVHNGTEKLRHTLNIIIALYIRYEIRDSSKFVLIL